MSEPVRWKQENKPASTKNVRVKKKKKKKKKEEEEEEKKKTKKKKTLPYRWAKVTHAGGR